MLESKYEVCNGDIIMEGGSSSIWWKDLQKIEKEFGALVLIGSLGTLIHKLGMAKLFRFCVEINTRLKKLMIPSYKE